LTRLLLTSADQLRDLPDGAILTAAHPAHRLQWLRVYGRPHPDPSNGLWTLPRNPFAEWHVAEIEAELPDIPDDTLLTGREPWLSTLDDPHDTTQPY
jgi:hypothetical protein